MDVYEVPERSEQPESLRDRFAMAALVSLIPSRAKDDHLSPRSAYLTAHDAYRHGRRNDAGPQMKHQTHDRMPEITIYHGIAAYADPVGEMVARRMIEQYLATKQKPDIERLVEMTSRETVRAVLGREP